MENNRLDYARTFMLTNARLLERQLFLYCFENGPREPVLAALQAYQNPDGGFGHGLESDVRCPGSQTLAVEKAFEMLAMVGAMDHPMVMKACDFLEKVSTAEGGVPFVLPASKGYPHTPWMEGPEHPPASLNPTASLVGMLLQNDVRHAWVERATQYCHKNIPEMDSNQFHDILPVVRFLQNYSDTAWAAAQLERISAIVRRSGTVELDPDADGYVQKPLDWAPEPDSFFRPVFNDETIALHLKVLAARQQPDGGWPISWQALGPGPELEWRGWMTIRLFTSWC